MSHQHNAQRTGLCASMEFEKCPARNCCPVEKQMYKITTKSPPMFVLPEQLPPCCPKLTTSCHACTKPHVGQSACLSNVSVDDD